MNRRFDWQRALDEFLQAHEIRRFEYGAWDCCLFVCDAVTIMTGVDPAAAFRGAYASGREAHRVVLASGAKSVEGLVEAVTAEYGMPETPVLLAQRGDVAFVKRSLGLVSLNGCEVILVSSKGLWRVPLAMASRAWHV